MENVIQTIRQRIDALLAVQAQVVVAIDGSCASGKSTLGTALAEGYTCNFFRMDDFFLRPEQRTRQRLAEPGGNIDYERFRQEILEPLKTGLPFSYRPYNCSTGCLMAPVAVQPRPLAIIEGSYSHHPCFGSPYDLTVFLTVDPEIRIQRIAKRPAFLYKRFLEEWIPMEQAYFEAFSIPEKADLVLTPADNR